MQLVDPAGNALPARKTGKIIFIVCSAVGGLAWIAGTIVTIRTIRKDRVKPHKYRDGIQVYSCGFLFWFLRIIWLVCSLMVRLPLARVANRRRSTASGALAAWRDATDRAVYLASASPLAPG